MCKGDGEIRYQEEWSSEHEFFFYMLFRGSKIDFLVWRSLCSFPLMSSPANLPFKCAREGVLHCEQLMTASSPSSTHTMTANSANSRIARSLEECKTCERRWWCWWAGCRDSALACARRLAALGSAWQRQGTPRTLLQSTSNIYYVPNNISIQIVEIVVKIFYEGVEQVVRKRS
jgi:hypothetical protein